MQTQYFTHQFDIYFNQTDLVHSYKTLFSTPNKAYIVHKTRPYNTSKLTIEKHNKKHTK
jgi:hypothetical protein